MAYTTQARVERAVGGAAVLVQLLDKDGDGIADAAMVTELLDRADAEVNSAIQVSNDLSAIAASTPNSVIFAATDVAAYLAFQFGSSGLAVPSDVEKRYQVTLRWLGDVAERKRTVGATVKPDTDQLVDQVDPDPDLDRVSRTSLKGFW